MLTWSLFTIMPLSTYHEHEQRASIASIVVKRSSTVVYSSSDMNPQSSSHPLVWEQVQNEKHLNKIIDTL